MNGLWEIFLHNQNILTMLIIFYLSARSQIFDGLDEMELLLSFSPLYLSTLESGNIVLKCTNISLYQLNFRMSED